MEQLTFGEQVKIILGRKGMTIKELAEVIEARTGKKMSRQNLTQRLGRDNFQEQDMRMIADILGCPFQLSIMSVAAEKMEVQKVSAEELVAPTEQEWKRVEFKRLQKAKERQQAKAAAESVEEPQSVEQEVAASAALDAEVDMTIGELYEIHEELTELEEKAEAQDQTEDKIENLVETGKEAKKERFRTGGIFLRKKSGSEAKEQSVREEQKQTEQEELQGTSQSVPQPESEDFEPVIKHDDVDENRELGELNPYTGREYQTNSVRMHPHRIGYVQVYDRTTHRWTDMTEWAFLGYQERKKALLGRDYEPPIYLD